MIAMVQMQRAIHLLSRQSAPETLGSLIRGWTALSQKMPKGFEKFFPKPGEQAAEKSAKPTPKGDCTV